MQYGGNHTSGNLNHCSSNFLGSLTPSSIVKALPSSLAQSLFKMTRSNSIAMAASHLLGRQSKVRNHKAGVSVDQSAVPKQYSVDQSAVPKPSLLMSLYALGYSGYASS